MLVRGEGPRGAKVCLVGEAPGDQEVKEGRPFVGGAGRVLDGMLQEAGLRREECYITNILTEQPCPSAATSTGRNAFESMYEDKAKKKPLPRLWDEANRLWAELQDVRPNIVVALGNEPLRWLTGKYGIKDWRGSVIESREECPGLKVMGTFHPAAVLRQWAWRAVSVFDYGKALKESAYPEIRRLQRVHHTIHRVEELEAYAQRLITDGRPVAFDIETEARQISVLSLASAPDWAVTIPIWWGPSGSLWSTDQELAIWRIVGEIFQRVPVVGQNVHYDLTYLGLYDVTAANLYMDTMIAFGILYPELPKALDFMATLYTDIPYWKASRTTKDMEEFWRYNALDAMATIQCAYGIEGELRETPA